MTTIRHELDLSSTPAAIYAALTTPAGIQAWWSRDSTIGSGPGAEHELRFRKGDRTVVMRFRVETSERDRLVAWTCTANGNPVWKDTTLRWEIAPSAKGARLVFEHAGFSEGASPPYQMTVDGWNHFMASLAGYLERGTGEPW